MLTRNLVAGLLLVSCLVVAPVQAGSLLGGSVGGTVGGLLGGSSSGNTNTSVGVPSVATVGLTSNSSGTSGSATVLGGGGSTLNVGLGGVLGGNSNLGVTLPGTGVGAVDSLTQNTTDTVNQLTGNGGTVDTLLGGVTGGGLLGPGAGGLLSGGGDSGGGNGVGNGYGNGYGSHSRLALGNLAGNCRAIDPRVISRLLNADQYGARTLASWHHAASVRVVPVKICSALKHSIRRQMSRDARFNAMQTVVASDPLLNLSLSRARYSARNVLAVDESRGMLTVYVF